MLAVNEYFSGKVKSIGFKNAMTGDASVGVMEAGEYQFSTNKPEVMTIITGALNVLLPNKTGWQVFQAGQAFEVPGNSQFSVEVADVTAYLCEYL